MPDRHLCKHCNRDRRLASNGRSCTSSSILCGSPTTAWIHSEAATPTAWCHSSGIHISFAHPTRTDRHPSQLEHTWLLSPKTQTPCSISRVGFHHTPRRKVQPGGDPIYRWTRWHGYLLGPSPSDEPTTDKAFKTSEGKVGDVDRLGR